MKRASLFLISALATQPHLATAGSLGKPAGEGTPVVANLSAAPSDWTGAYAGGQIGHLSYDSFATAVPLTGAKLYEGSGGTYGLHAGYLHDFGSLVLGVEAEINFSDIDLDFVPTPVGSPYSIDRSALMKARLGYDAGRFLPYVAAGYGWVEIDNSGGASQRFKGPAYGIGLSYLWSDRMMIGAEILRQDLDAYQPTAVTQEAEVTTISLRASWRF